MNKLLLAGVGIGIAAASDIAAVAVIHRRPVQDENKIDSSVLGVVAGGVLGHQFGGGQGRDVATVADALAGVCEQPGVG